MQSVALFIDLENIVTSLWKLHQQSPNLFTWMEQVREYGTVSFGRAYGDFNQPSIAKLEPDLRSLGIDKFDCTPKQNGQSTVDSNVVIDLYEVAYDLPSIETFVLMAGDSDYTRVVAKLRQRLGKQIIVMGVPGSISRELVRAAGREESLRLAGATAVDDAAIIRLIDRFESTRREGMFPTYRFMSQYLQHPTNAGIIPAEFVNTKLNELLQRGVLVQSVVETPAGGEIRVTRLDRALEEVESALAAPEAAREASAAASPAPGSSGQPS